MTSTGKTSKSQTESISFEFDLPHSPQKVWRVLTDPTLLAEWLLPIVNLKLEVGEGFTFNAPPQPSWDGIVSCRFVEIEMQRKLSYTWVVGDIDTIVTFLGILVPIAAAFIVVEMLLFCGVHIYSGDANYGPMIYWLVVAAISAFIAYGRILLWPF